MTEKKKRQKVVAEITLAHMTQFADELGRPMNEDEAIAFLNKEGRAYEMWKHMMHAAEEYIKAALQRQRLQVETRPPVSQRRIAV
jgi:hypothetical protein